MANNYTQTSLLVSDLTDSEKEWVNSNTDFICVRDLNGEYQVVADDEDYDYEMPRLFLRRDMEEGWHFRPDEFETLEFQWEFQGSDLWIYGEEYANIDHICAFLQLFLKDNRPDDCITFTWADTCSKLRIGEFSGGGAFITADSIEFVSAYQWVSDKASEFRKEKKNG
jgi:hypothetical protein